MSIGQNIRARREALGKTQVWLAEKAGCLQSQISEWERDNGVPRMDTAVAIAKALRVSIATLTKDDADALADTVPPLRREARVDVDF